MSKRHPYGIISPQRAEQMRANLPARYGPILDLLVDRPPVRAAARYVDVDDGDDGEFDHLFQPRTRAEHERQARRRERIAASAAARSDDELYDAIFPLGPGQ